MMRDLDVSDPVYPSFAILPETAVWTDYDGVWASSDYTIGAFGHAVPGTDYETGFAEVDPLGQVSYMHTDQIGTLRGVTDDTATVTTRPVYTAFGERVFEDGAVGTRYRYAGAWGYESFAGLDWGTHDWGGPNGVDTLEFPYLHVGHRYYNPATGRFLQRDPIGVWGGPNVYAYVENAPISVVDPSGLQAVASPIPPYYSLGGAGAAKEMAETLAMLGCVGYAASNSDPRPRVGDPVDPTKFKRRPRRDKLPRVNPPKPPGDGDGHPAYFSLLAMIAIFLTYAGGQVLHRRSLDKRGRFQA